MKAVVMRRWRGRLRIEERPVPVPGPGQYLLKVHSAGVNPLDWKLRKGIIPLLLPLRFPLGVGFDVCGQVVRSGPGANRFHDGDWLYGTTDLRTLGSCAEYVLVRERCVAEKPPDISPAEAAAIPVAAETALQCLRDKARVMPGQNVLVVGASGGVGHFAVQIARAMGASVTAVTSGRNVGFATRLGADRVVDYEKEDFLHSQNRYDVVLDAVAAHSYGAVRNLLQKGGSYVSTVPSPSTIFYKFFLPLVSSNRVYVINVKRRSGDLEFLNRLISEGKLRATVSAEFGLDEVAKAHDLSQTGRAVGKIVVNVQ